MKTELSIVGRRAPRVDAVKLSTGRGTYTDDIHIRGMLHVKLAKSPHPHARIVHIDTTRARSLPGVQDVITYEDVPRIPYTSAGQSWPEPSPYDMYILDQKVRFVGDPVAAVAAETPRIASEAAKLVEAEYEVLPAVLDMHDAMTPGAPIIHDEPESYGIYDASSNIAAHIDVEMGDVERGLADADIVLENEFFVQYQQHTCLEPHVTICFFDEDSRLVVRTSTQIPYHCRRMLAFALGIPVRNVHVIKPRVGGGFGNKQEVVTEPLAAVLAMRTRRPVKLEFNRTDEFTIARMRHPQHLTLRTQPTTLDTAKPAVLIEFADTGVGIPAEHLDTVLEPFFTTRRPQANGLGLNRVYHTALRHRGSVHVESAEGEGTRVSLRLLLLSKS